ncbi:MAG: BlaI/MecI/CopY family transcriptional regulator [Melioribacteraceae bacterium]|nr:BlaI/MecI/CopY family transcriptional regulator [Melioribacteraceae bacterium]
MNKNKYNPTESELEVLKILWTKGPSTVQTVNDELNKSKEVGYTTTLKIMQIMSDKGLVNRTKAGRKHIYNALVNQHAAQKILLEKVLDTAFSGSAMNLVMHALGNTRTSKHELNQIKQLIEKLEREQND